MYGMCSPDFYQLFLLAYLYLASFPGSSAWAERKAWYTLFAHAQFPQDFWEFGNFP